MTCEECTAIGIPEHLCLSEKETPLNFVDEECIYRRHDEPGDASVLRGLSEAQIGRSVFKLNNDSYNRSSLSNVEDVLLNSNLDQVKDLHHFRKWGIIAIDVQAVNSILAEVNFQDKLSLCSLRVEHTPEHCNYSHAEIFLYIDGVKWDGIAPKSAKPFLRRRLKEHLRVIKEYSLHS